MIKVKDEDHKIVKEIELDPKNTYEEDKFENEPNIAPPLPKSNFFNLVSLVRKEIPKDESDEEISFTKEDKIATKSLNESITKIRQTSKRKHVHEHPKNNLGIVSKTLEFDSPYEDTKDTDERIIVPNPFCTSLDQEIEAIEEASNETFTTVNDNKELDRNDDTLFGLPQTSIHREGKFDSCLYLDTSSSQKSSQEDTSDLQNSCKAVIVSSVSFQRKDSSEHQIKELFMSNGNTPKNGNTALSPSSPDFEYKNDVSKECKCSDQEEYFGKYIALT